jgi:hypothetical protein
MKNIDIKLATDTLENNHGCPLLESVQGLHFSEQQTIVDKIQAEANSRPDNHLSFDKSKFPIIDPNGKKDGELSTIIIKNDGQLVFEAINGPIGQDVQNFCRNVD